MSHTYAISVKYRIVGLVYEDTIICISAKVYKELHPHRLTLELWRKFQKTLRRHDEESSPVVPPLETMSFRITVIVL